MQKKLREVLFIFLLHYSHAVGDKFRLQSFSRQNEIFYQSESISLSCQSRDSGTWQNAFPPPLAGRSVRVWAHQLGNDKVGRRLRLV